MFQRFCECWSKIYERSWHTEHQDHAVYEDWIIAATAFAQKRTIRITIDT